MSQSRFGIYSCRLRQVPLAPPPTWPLLRSPQFLGPRAEGFPKRSVGNSWSFQADVSFFICFLCVLKGGWGSVNHAPSGKRLHNNGNSPFFKGKTSTVSTFNGLIPHWPTKIKTSCPRSGGEDSISPGFGKKHQVFTRCIFSPIIWWNFPWLPWGPDELP